MKMRNARVVFTDRARRDIERCRHFLRRQPGSRLMERTRDVTNAVRFIKAHPKLHPVERLSLIGLELRRRKAGKFVLVYSYFEPSPSEPDGLVSVRAVRHEREEDVYFGVREPRSFSDAEQPSFLVLD